MINLPDDVTIHVFKGVKLMDIYDKTTGFPRLDNELTRHENGLDKEWAIVEEGDGPDKPWAKNRNRDIGKEVGLLREYIEFLNDSYSDIDKTPIVAMEERIENLLEERDKNCLKYGLYSDGLDKDWARSRNKDIEDEVLQLRDYLSNNYVSVPDNEEIRSKISELLKERDDITYKYGLAGEHFNRLYLDKTGADRDGDILSNESRFKFITEEMDTLYSQKNADYGDAFTQSLDEDGLLVSKIRLKDKLNRFSQLIENDALVKDESIRDTLIDLANYSVMTLMWLDNFDIFVEIEEKDRF